MAADKKRDALRKTVKKLVNQRTSLDHKADEAEGALISAMREAYDGGVSAIELSELTGISRQNIYDWLRRDGDIVLQQPKGKKKKQKKAAA